MSDFQLPDMLESGELARLIPVVPDSQKEQRVVAVVLATFRVVPEFALALLGEVGAPSGKTAKIECYTEVVFRKTKEDKKRLRPDGLIVVTLGKRVWTAIIEAKAGTARLTNEQVEEYIAIARTHDVNAVITISNQYAVLPTHHPLDIPKSRRKTVELFHFSWAAIATKATVLSDTKKVADVEQAFILKEVIRFLQHDSSGTLTFTKMSPGWKETALAIQQRLPLKANDANLQDAIGSWHELTKFLCLELSSALSEIVVIKLPRNAALEQSRRFADDVNLMMERQLLKCEFDIPNTAGILKITADFLRRVIILSVEVGAPQDRARAPSVINWLTRQLPVTSDDAKLLIRAAWRNRTQKTAAFLSQVREDTACLIGSNKSLLPRSFEVIRTIVMAGRFIQSQNFVEDVKSAVPIFYSDVIQHLKEWSPSPPKIKESKDKEGQVGSLSPVASENHEVVSVTVEPQELVMNVDLEVIPRADEGRPVKKEEASAILGYLSKRLGS